MVFTTLTRNQSMKHHILQYSHDERPSQVDKAAQISYDYEYQERGNEWVKGRMPWRSGVNQDTYSCIWGLTSNTDDGENTLLESTRNDPLNSREATFTPTNHSLVKNKYDTYSSSSITEETSSSVDICDKYSGDDGRGSVDDTDDDMFSYSDAHPYCTTPNEMGILNNIVCS